MAISAPVVFFVYNRPDLTRRVFNAIAQVEPTQLFVVADGPRGSAEAEKCAQTRAIIDSIGWTCDVRTDFADTNMGCGRRIASGLNRVFAQVEEAIILEDDTLPSASFFTFCQTLLERYRHDERIMRISGNNFQFGQRRSAYSYHFSKYGACWGWATWRRTWQYYDHEMKGWPEFRDSGMLAHVCEDPYELQFWTETFDGMIATPPLSDTWDHQLEFACWAQGGLAVEPCVNLVSNIGLGRADASHTKQQDSLWADYRLPGELTEIVHPPFIVRHREADAFLFDHVIGGSRMRERATTQGKLRRRLAPLKEKVLSACSTVLNQWRPSHVGTKAVPKN